MNTYHVVRNNKKITKNPFYSYEKARQFVRKQLRKLQKYARSNRQPACWMRDYGFQIVRM
jgi:hypothetical protein